MHIALQGFDGHYVRYNPRAVGGLGGFDIAPEAGIPRVQRQLMLRICELGWLFRYLLCCQMNAPVCGLLMGASQTITSLRKDGPEALEGVCAEGLFIEYNGQGRSVHLLAYGLAAEEQWQLSALAGRQSRL